MSTRRGTRRSWRNQDRLYSDIGAQLSRAADTASPSPPAVEYADCLYDECVKRGIPLDHHESDLYIPVTEETRALLLRYGHHKRGPRAAAATFIDQVVGGLWYDVPFAYAPFWRRAAR